MDNGLGINVVLFFVFSILCVVHSVMMLVGDTNAPTLDIIVFGLCGIVGSVISGLLLLHFIEKKTFSRKKENNNE